MKRPFQIFLCYARQDEERVSTLYEKLSLAGFQPFMAPRDILPGEDWKLKLLNTIREAPFFLACVSHNSIDKRGVIQEEIREALDVWRQKLAADIYLIPVRLDDCPVPDALAKFQWVDLFQKGAFERLKIAIDSGVERLGGIRPVRLRSQRLLSLSREDVQTMLRRNDFFDRLLNGMGKGMCHEYELLEDGKVVFDRNTSLAWQRSGSSEPMGFSDAEEYVHALRRSLCNWHWRLPTLEEAMSLMEPRKFDEFYIDPVFNRVQDWIWTTDKTGDGTDWYISFNKGSCIYLADKYPGYYFARAVCSKNY